MSQVRCQICFKEGHTSVNCSDLYLDCQKPNCQGIMLHYICNHIANSGRRFLQCQFCRARCWYEGPVPAPTDYNVVRGIVEGEMEEALFQEAQNAAAAEAAEAMDDDSHIGPYGPYVPNTDDESEGPSVKVGNIQKRKRNNK